SRSAICGHATRLNWCTSCSDSVVVSTFWAVSCGLAGQLVDETHDLGEGAVAAVRAEAGREGGVEGGRLVAAHWGRRERCGQDPPGVPRGAPVVFDGEFMLSGLLKPGVGEPRAIGPPLPHLLPARGNPLLGAERRPPPVEGGLEGSLPVLPAYPGSSRP